MAERLLTTQEVADYLGVPLASLYAWNMRGTGPRYVKVGRYARYRPIDVETWLSRQYANPQGAA